MKEFAILFLFLISSCTTRALATQSQKDDDRITSLPGQPRVEFEQYSGYITVNDLHGRALFYWFMQAASDPSNKPLVLWLNGGPGCSSIGAGAASELGPFLINGDGATLHSNAYSWNKEANMLFVESPIGVGFSYTNTTSDLGHLNDENSAEDAYMFLLKWFERFPEYKSHQFYLAGESYAGHYVPQLAEAIFEGNKKYSPSPINLKGFMVGNALTDDNYDWVGMMDYAWTHAIISDSLHHNITKTCDFSLYDLGDECDANLDQVFVEYNKIDIYNIYLPACIQNSTSTNSFQNMNIANSKGSRRRPLIPAGANYYDPCFINYPDVYFNRPDVQEALHVRSVPYQWVLCTHSILFKYNSSVFTLLPTYKKLINGGLKIWVYSGDADGRIPVTSTRYTLSELGLRIKENFYTWYHHNQVAGRVIEYEGLTFVTVRGAGHLVPVNKPSESLALFGSFLRGEPLPKIR